MCQHVMGLEIFVKLLFYYHLRSTLKCERFFAHVYFSNETVSQTTVLTGPMKMFRLEHETMNVCQRNVVCFVHMECRFSTFFRVLEAWCLCDCDGGAKSKQIWMNLSYWNISGSSSRCKEL